MARFNALKRKGTSSTPKLPSTARKAVRKVVKDVIKNNAELKHFDLFAGGVSAVQAPTGYAGLLTNTAQIVSVSGVTQGISDSQRIGDQISVKSLDFKVGMQYRLAGAAFESKSCLARCLIVQYIPNTAVSTLTPLQIFEQNLNTAWSYPAVDTAPTVRILYDKTRVVTAIDNNLVLFKGKIKPRSTKIQYQAGSLNCTNNLYVVVITDQGSVSLGDLEYAIATRLKYWDM